MQSWLPILVCMNYYQNRLFLLLQRPARNLARTWGSSFADAGEVGHINAESGLGDWTFGRLLLNRLLPRHVALESGSRSTLYGAFQPDRALRRIGG